ncbi:hypothetical protein SJI00_07150 [Pseudomonas sp. RP23018S]|uniref:hypothetical protein n=1 Tax=Pseudomonas sp. RP23018S TaxID=3096037 RepID=UPI002ACA2889|nr:hypothetical protein [Pseudomonas sp. RP23018S]MDZ5602546.1 hypothetical protein [Pseudomonas sp. RP23018S]
MKIRASGSSVTIDGRTFTGRNISINGDKVVVDGVEQAGSLVGPVSVTVNGNAESVENGSGTVTVTGSAGQIETMSGDVYCGAVSGDVETMSGDVTCGPVTGKVKTTTGDIIKR